MTPTRQRLSATPAAMVSCIVILSVLVTPISTAASAEKSVAITECAIEGFAPGDTADQMREAFGKPHDGSVVKSNLSDYPHREYEYDGMRIVFSISGRSAMSFYVASPKYRLRSGIGVGSTWMEVVDALGPGSLGSAGGSNTYSYQIVDSKGDYIPAWLKFVIEDEVVRTFSVTTMR